jgi:hypothetical protein
MYQASSEVKRIDETRIMGPESVEKINKGSLWMRVPVRCSIVLV